MKKVVFLMMLAAFFQQPAVSQTTNYSAYSLILINVAKYAEWPDNGSEHFLIAVVGKSKVYDELSKKQGLKVGSKAVAVVQVNDIGEISGTPNVVYISDNKSSLIDGLNARYGSEPVMLVGEREGLHRKGAHMSFIIVDDTKLRFDINKTEMLKRNLKISNNILTIANEVI